MVRCRMCMCLGLIAMFFVGCGDGGVIGGQDTERQEDVGCQGAAVLCGDTCVILEDMHWRACGECVSGYSDSDGDASNGCEAASLKCEDGQVICAGACVKLAEMHWSSCGSCAGGYEDADGDAANGCESSALPLGKCHADGDCAGLLHVSVASCQSGACVISACADGFADCDKDVANGCEVNGLKDFYHCDGSVTCPSRSSGDACYGGGVGHSLDYFAAHNNTSYAPAWDCGNDSSGTQEARDIVKSIPDQQGGRDVLQRPVPGRCGLRRWLDMPLSRVRGVHQEGGWIV